LQVLLTRLGSQGRTGKQTDPLPNGIEHIAAIVDSRKNAQIEARSIDKYLVLLQATLVTPQAPPLSSSTSCRVDYVL
jgi:hypothetical protein